MKSFDLLLTEGRIKPVTPQQATAESMLDRADSRLQAEQDRRLDEETAFLVLENVYEALREVVEAGMAMDGFTAEDHVASIAYADEHLDISRQEIETLHRFRKLRNESRYDARDITVQEAEDILAFANNFLPRIRSEVEQRR